MNVLYRNFYLPVVSTFAFPPNGSFLSRWIGIVIERTVAKRSRRKVDTDMLTGMNIFLDRTVDAKVRVRRRLANGLLTLGVFALGLVVPQEARAADLRCAPMQAVDYSSHDNTVQRLRQLYQAGNFAQLDEALSCLLRSPERFRSGKPGASAVYWMFRRQMPGPGTDPSEALHVRRWKQAMPQSMFAQFAELRLQYAMAWNARGSDYARDTPREGMRLFSEGMRSTEQAVLKAPAALKNTPIWQNLLLAVVLDAPERQTNPRTVFEEGVARWPEYYDFYEVALSRLVPKWGGSWDVVDEFIAYWGVRLKATEGDSLYARLYTGVIAGGANLQETKIVWPRMRSSLEDLVSRYPDVAHRNLAASYACAYQDAAYFKAALQRLRADEINPAAWLRGIDPETCKRLIRN